MSARVASTQVRLAEFRRNVENVDMIYLGIDSGTQSTKTIALDLDSGDILAQASAQWASRAAPE